MRNQATMTSSHPQECFYHLRNSARLRDMCTNWFSLIILCEKVILLRPGLYFSQLYNYKLHSLIGTAVLVWCFYIYMYFIYAISKYVFVCICNPICIYTHLDRFIPLLLLIIPFYFSGYSYVTFWASLLENSGIDWRLSVSGSEIRLRVKLMHVGNLCLEQRMVI